MEFRVEIQSASEFYPTYVEWSEDHGFPPLVEDGLDMVFVCYRGDVPVYACFFWRTPSSFAMIGFPFSNKKVPKREREGGLDFLFARIVEQARMAGYRILWTTSDTSPVEDTLKRQGFVPGDVQVDQYLKILA